MISESLHTRPNRVRCFAVFLLVLASVLYCAQAQQKLPPPHIFFTDLISGPAIGGQNGQGAFITLYGVGFGSRQGASWVSIGNARVVGYPLWTDSRVVIQLGARARTGSLVVHIPGFVTNGVPFTVRSGRIFFVSPNGNDNNAGGFASPWRTLVHARQVLRPGDIAYAMNGLQQTRLDDYDASLAVRVGGRAGAPLAIVSYPGATVTIGSPDGPPIAMRTPNINGNSDHWVLAGLTFRGREESLDVTDSKDWRIIGNDFSCRDGVSLSGCVTTANVNYIAFLGNHVHDVAKSGVSKTYHAVYFSTDSNHIDVGWNTIARVRGCRGLQFHSSPTDPGTGNNQYDLHVHDNFIHDTVCDAINFATVNPSHGVVEAYNNVIYNAGTGPAPADGDANYSCIYVQGGAEHGAPGSGTVYLYNNTLYNCGARGNTNSGALALSGGSPHMFVRLRNNILLQKPNEALISADSVDTPLTGDNNIVWGSNDGLDRLRAHTQHLVNKDPLLANPASGDLVPLRGSPALASGSPVPLRWDIRGFPRLLNTPPDLGAYQQSGHF